MPDLPAPNSNRAWECARQMAAAMSALLGHEMSADEYIDSVNVIIAGMEAEAVQMEADDIVYNDVIEPSRHEAVLRMTALQIRSLLLGINACSDVRVHVHLEVCDADGTVQCKTDIP
jgi:hypothetical protein